MGKYDALFQDSVSVPAAKPAGKYATLFEEPAQAQTIPRGSGGPLQGLRDIAMTGLRQFDRVPAAIGGSIQGLQDFKSPLGPSKMAIQGFLHPETIQTAGRAFERAGVPNKPIPIQDVNYPAGAGLDAPGGATVYNSGGMAPGVADQMGELTSMAAPTGLEILPGLKAAKMLAKSEIAGKSLGAAAKVSNLPNKAAGKMAQELSSVSEEALRMASTKEGRKALQANAGKEYEIGQRLVHMMDNPETFAANKVKVDAALKGMGEVDIMPVVKALQDAKVKRPSGKLFKHERKANEAIQQDINDLLGQNGRTKISAEEALDLRRGMDKAIDFKAPEGKLLDNAKKKGRLALKDLLESRALESGSPEYVETMDTWSKQLDAKDRLEAFLGKNKGAQEDRAEAFISNMWGKNKRNRQKVMADIGEVFGPEFLQESKLANLAAQLGPEGKATLFSRSSTGRSKLGGTLGFFAGGSPMLASRVILPLAELPPKGLQWLQKLSQAKNPAETAFYTANLKKMGLDDGGIQEGIAAVKPPEPPPTAPAAAIAPAPTPVKPVAAAEKKIAEFSPQESINRRIAAFKYLKETTGDAPGQGQLYDFLKDLGDKPVPKVPEKPKISREFNGRRPRQDLDFLESALKGGTPGYPTTAVPIKDAPESFTLHGTEFKRVKSKWDNMITYKDAQGQKHEFRGNEVIHMDAPLDKVPF